MTPHWRREGNGQRSFRRTSTVEPNSAPNHRRTGYGISCDGPLCLRLCSAPGISSAVSLFSTPAIGRIAMPFRHLGEGANHLILYAAQAIPLDTAQCKNELHSAAFISC